MPSTLDLDTFRRHLTGKTIDVARAAKDSRLSGFELSKVDLNRDGLISTKAEINALFHQIDKADTNGSSRSVSLSGKNGELNNVATLVQAVGELAGVNILRELARDDIIIVGMNEGSKHEASALKRGGRNVVFIRDSKEDDKIDINGKRYNLRDAGELRRFVELLGLPAKQSDEIAAAITSSSIDAADEVASIAWSWAPAEKGHDIPGRLVISGHSYGDGVFGHGNGSLKLEVIAALAKAMPKAAARVEDLHISGCYSAGALAIARWRLVFVNVVTIWAYSGSAPSSLGGAASHLVLWEQATRGSKDSINRLIAAKTTKGESVAVWSRVHGYEDGKAPESLGSLRSQFSDAQPMFTSYFTGNMVDRDPQIGELRNYYNVIQSMLQHPQMTAADRPALEKKRDVTIRLIFYVQDIRGKFASTYARLIAAGYKALGLAPPDFSRLSRKDALASIALFTGAANAKTPLPPDAQVLRPLLEQGLRDLLPGTIPDTWI